MRPALTTNDSGNSSLRNAVLGRELILGDATKRVSFSNLQYVLLGQFSRSILRSLMQFFGRLSADKSPVSSRISHISSVISEIKVRGIYARRDVASMANKKTIFDWAYVQFIGNSVRLAHSSRAIRSAPNRKQSISCAIFAGNPNPAFPDDLKFFVKSYLHISRFWPGFHEFSYSKGAV